MSDIDYLDFTMIRPRRRSPDELYYGSDAFRRDPARWLARYKRQHNKTARHRAFCRARDDRAARRRRGWLTDDAGLPVTAE